MTPDTKSLLAEYLRLWRVFRETPNNRGPDMPPRQVCFDIDRVERELKAAGIPEPFDLVRTDREVFEAIAAAPEIEPPQIAAEPQPAQLALF